MFIGVHYCLIMSDLVHVIVYKCYNVYLDLVYVVISVYDIYLDLEYVVIYDKCYNVYLNMVYVAVYKSVMILPRFGVCCCL